MEGASGAEAASSGEQIELELEGSAANDDQPSSCAADDNPHDQEEGKCWSGSGDRYFKFMGFVLCTRVCCRSGRREAASL